MAGHAAILDILLKVDSAKATAGLSQFDTRVKKTAAETSATAKKMNEALEIKPSLETTQLKKDIRKTKADLMAFSKVKATPEIELATAGASAHLKAMEAQLAAFAAKDYNVDVNVDRDGAARGTFQTLFGLARNLTSVIGTQLTGAMQSAGGSMSGLSTTAGTTGGNLTLLASIAGEAAAVIGVVVVAAVGAAVTALVALAASAIAASGALGALAVAAAALAIPFAALSAGAMARFEADSETAGTSAFRLRKRMMEVADAAVKNFGPGIDAVFRSVGDLFGRLPNLMKALSPAFTAFSKSVGRAINEVGKEFTRPIWVKFFTFLLNSAGKVAGPLTKTFIIFARLLARIAKASMPFLIQGLKALNQWLKGVGDKAPGVKKLGDIIGGLVDHLKSWWNLGKGLVGIIAGIFTAAVGPGKSLVDTLAKGAQSLSDWVNSAEGQERIKKFFSDVMPLVKQLVTFLSQLTLIAIQLFQALAPTFASILSVLNLVLKPVIFLLELFNKIPASVRSWAIPGLVAPAIGAIILFVNIVKLLISVWNKIKPVAKAVLDWLKGAVGDVASWIKDRWNGLVGVFRGPFEKIKNAAQDAFAWLKQAISDVVGWLRNAWNNVGDVITKPFETAVSKIRGFINDIIGIINTVLGPVGVHIGEVGGGGGGDTSTAGTGQQGHPHKKKQRGGGIGGSGSGDTVPAMLEPGEFVLNRNAVQRVGLQKLNAINNAVPRFQAGGEVQHFQLGSFVEKAAKVAGVGIPDPPGLGGIPGWLKPAAQFVIDKAWAFMRDKAGSLLGGGGGAGPGEGGAGGARTVAVGRWLQGQGFSVGENPAFGGVHPVHVPNSLHYDDSRAIDVNWPNASQEPAHLRPIYDLLAKGSPRPTELFYQNRGIPTPVANHYDHLHVGYQSGGGVPRPAHGSHWIKGGNRWSVDEAATLLWQAGLSRQDAGELARVVPGESGGNPRAHNASGATGLFQILGAVRPGNLYDPRINALNAAIKWRTQGRGAWEAASTGPPGQILMDAIGGNGGGGGGDATSGGGTTKEKFQTAFPGISLKLLQKLHRSLLGPAKAKIQANVQAAKAALASAKGPAAKIAATQGLNAAKGAKVGFLGALATYQKAKKSGTGVRKALEALVTMEQALTAPGEAVDPDTADTSLLDAENERIRSMNELISQGNLLALQGFQVSASQNPLLGLNSATFPTQTPLSPLLTSLPSAAAAPTTAGGGGQHVHVHIHKHKGVNDLVDARIEKQTRKAARKGNRRLPSGRGA